MPITKATITAKRQMTIPAAVRESLQLEPGDTVAIEPGEDKTMLRKVRSIEPSYILSVRGRLSGVDFASVTDRFQELVRTWVL